MTATLPVDPKVKTTKVVGFYNPNDFPVTVNLSVANLNITLAKGEYIKTRDNQKVNDPRLEQFVGLRMLAREESSVQVPFIMMAQAPAAANHPTGFASSNTVVKDKRGIVQTSTPNTPAPVSAQDSSVRVYTREEALRKGLIKPIDFPREDARPDTPGQPGRLDNVTEMKLAKDAAGPKRAQELMSKVTTTAPTAYKTPVAPPPKSLGEHEDASEMQTDDALDSTPELDIGELTKSLMGKLAPGK